MESFFSSLFPATKLITPQRKITVLDTTFPWYYTILLLRCIQNLDAATNADNDDE